MPIYEIDPIDLNDPDWNGSTHKGPCVVRADNERYACLAAALAFHQGGGRELGENVPINPWNQEDKVEVHLVAEHGFNEDGPQMVLAPAGDHPTLEDKDGKPLN